MKKIVLSILCLVVLSPMFSQSNIVSGEILVMFKSGYNVTNVLNEINTANSSANLEIIKPISRRINAWHLSYTEATTTPVEAINLFADRQDVEIVQYNHDNVKLRDTLCPDDTQFNEQWNFYNDGTNGSGGTVDISACDAWAITTGGTTAQGDPIVVAVIDGGFQISHEDINFFENATEATVWMTTAMAMWMM